MNFFNPREPNRKESKPSKLCGKRINMKIGYKSN
jgi:hypothetical protein